MSKSLVARAALLALVAATSFTGNGATAAPVSPAVSGLYDDALAAVEQSVPEFAGVWVEDGRLVVSLTRPGAAAGAAARDALAQALGRKDISSMAVAVRPARFSFTSLKGWHDAISADVLALPGAVLTDVDERNNVVRVGVEDVAATGPQVRAVAAAHGVPAAALAIEHADPVTPVTLSNPHLPAVGGLEIGYSAGGGLWVCTLGFPALRGGVHGFVTNSHCTATRGVVESTLHTLSSQGPPIGVEVADPPHFTGGACPAGRLCRYSDTVFSTLVNAAGGPMPFYDQGRIAAPPVNSTSWGGVVTPTFRITAESNPVLGETLTKVGRTTGRTVGSVGATCTTYNVAGSNLTMVCQGQASLGVQGGDSGSPIFAITSGIDVTLKGIVWGSGGVFSPIGNIQMGAELGSVQTCATGFGC